MAQLSLLLFSASEELRATLGEMAHVELTASASDPKDLQGLVRKHRPDVLFVDLGDDPQGMLDLLDTFPAPRPVLLVAGRQDDSPLILRAMRLGAREFLAPDPDPDVLNTAITRLLLEHQPAEQADKVAPVIAVIGSKGGVGTTFAACHLAAELERLNARVVVVDVNLRVGDVSLYFDLHPRYTLANLAAEHAEFDSAYLHTILEPHASGVHVLAAPRRAEEADFVDCSHVERAVGLLRREFDWVILDVSRTWDETSVRALDLADEILLVTSMDLPTLNHARQHLDLMQRLGHSTEQIRLIANRHSRSDPVRDKDFSEFLGREPDARIPNDYPTALACVNEGKPLHQVAQRSPLRCAYTKLAERLHDWCEVPLPPRDVAKDSRLRRYFRREFWKNLHGAA